MHGKNCFHKMMRRRFPITVAGEFARGGWLLSASVVVFDDRENVQNYLLGGMLSKGLLSDQHCRSCMERTAFTR